MIRKIVLLMAFATAGVLQAAPQRPVPPEFTNVTGKYVKLRTTYVPRSAAAGHPLGLIVEVTPGPKMHLYAPGQKGYIPVALEIAKSLAYAALPITYPKSTLYEFAPLQERVQVYARPFTLTQGLLLKSVAGESLTISATFSYQACDDQVCYRPETLNLEWKVPLVAR